LTSNTLQVRTPGSGAADLRRIVHTPTPQQQSLLLPPAVHLAATAAALLFAGSALAQQPEENFGTKCAGCHIGGGNIQQPGSTLFTADLERNGVADSETLYSLIYSGKGRMPGFGKECTPRVSWQESCVKFDNDCIKAATITPKGSKPSSLQLENDFLSHSA